LLLSVAIFFGSRIKQPPSIFTLHCIIAAFAK
jgi:hypothetical protein